MQAQFFPKTISNQLEDSQTKKEKLAKGNASIFVKVRCITFFYSNCFGLGLYVVPSYPYNMPFVRLWHNKPFCPNQLGVCLCCHANVINVIAIIIFFLGFG
ncbi:hypothetical protein XENTR_v10016779 [Xenopus tropicalis]|nr:hypothetical protein XENTR_v10016779 [Xenopus tropicalis]